MADEPNRQGDTETQTRQSGSASDAIWAYHDGRTEDQGPGRPRKPKPVANILPLWQAMWEEFDLSWEGLADTSWEYNHASYAQRIKQWRAPAGVEDPGGWTRASLQDYWRMGQGASASLTCWKIGTKCCT